MKKKNTFKQQKLYSLQTYRTEKTSAGEIIAIIFIMTAIAVTWSILA